MIYQITARTSDGYTLTNYATSISEAATLAAGMWREQVGYWRCKWCSVRIHEAVN